MNTNEKILPLRRHSDRDDIPKGSFGNEILLNEKGKQNAQRFVQSLAEMNLKIKVLNEINQKGYCVLKNWEDEEIIQILLNSVIRSNGELTTEVFEYWTEGKLPSLLLQIFGKHVYGHTCNVRNKNKINFKKIPYHQDSAYILPSSFDTEEFLQITCWLPLVDVSIENGTLEVSDTFENKQVSHFLKNGYMQICENINSIPLILKSGSIVLMHHNLIHSSKENKTNNTRWSIDFRYQNIQTPFLGMTQGFEIYPKRQLNYNDFNLRRVRFENSQTHKYSLIK